jgi:hypothetical protein
MRCGLMIGLGMAAVGYAYSAAAAAETLPDLTSFAPDIVLECFFDDKAASQCQIACGSQFGTEPKAVVYQSISRVEIFNKGSSSRSWILLKQQESQSAKPITFAVTFGPETFCSFNMEVYSGDHKTQLRLTKFPN